MAPTAMYLPEDTSDKFGTDKFSSMKKMGQEKSHLYDLDIRGSTPEIDLHDLAVQNPFQSLSGSTAFESSGSKSKSSLGLGFGSGSGSGLSSKKHEFHSSSSIGSLRGSLAGHHHNIGGLSGALGSIGMETQRVEFSEELSESEKSQFMATIDAMDQLARQSSSMKSVFATIVSQYDC